jgi:hypothetical protein
MEKKPYQVGTTPILHDGERYDEGAEILLTDKEAAGLGDHVIPIATAAGNGDDTKTPKKGGKA